MALINKLEAIGDAIRAKTGKTDLLTLDAMVTEIEAIETGGGGAELPEEAFTITGNCNYRFANNGWSWFVENYGDKVNTVDVNNTYYMFYLSDDLTNIPFDINITKAVDKNMAYTFYGCKKITSIPLIKCDEDFSAPTSNYSGIATLTYFFGSCEMLREIPYDYFHNFGGTTFWNESKEYNGYRASMFSNCHSLRNLPDLSMLPTKQAYSGSLYYNAFNNCYSLDEIVDLPVVIPTSWTNNAFIHTFNCCSRVKDIIFAPIESGKTATWSNQTIDLTYYVGYTGNTNGFYHNSLNTGITADKEVRSVEQYQALKDDADWYAVGKEYSRYNHDSAVRTINSLPDVSSKTGNTIKFLGESGSATDGGAINTLTEEEIAVATVKGWTVTLV